MDYSSATLSTYNDFQGLASLRAEAQKDQSKAVDRVAEQFEGMFLNIMIKEMRKTVPESEFFDTPSMKLFQEMQDQQVAMEMAKESPLGFAKLLKSNIQLQSTDKKTGFSNGVIHPEHMPINIKSSVKTYDLNHSGSASYALDKYKSIERVE